MERERQEQGDEEKQDEMEANRETREEAKPQQPSPGSLLECSGGRACTDEQTEDHSVKHD